MTSPSVQDLAAEYLEARRALQVALWRSQHASQSLHDAEDRLIAAIVGDESPHGEAVAVGQVVLNVREEHWELPRGARIQLINLLPVARTA